MVQKDRAFAWLEECQEAFSSLQRALIGAAVLAPTDPILPFILGTDANNVGMGEVLAQVGPEGEGVVTYFSRMFDKAKQRYCVTRWKLRAVLLASRHFKYYLWGLPFTVRPLCSPVAHVIQRARGAPLDRGAPGL
ncbi:hypothetical protein AAFF_G00351340 [Aldrovandia affinis]|uniref:Reverse transcriptase/retrotransposon-derived protein RNase H-like domain-containing protein n=1 Tax=Aldrovandia affinis TaxID=143900 RepID=A0AAD7WNE9_9TELE|nr:hypothetical protein AAFF_G00351340 [Aldrovandia affinis]